MSAHEQLRRLDKLLSYIKYKPGWDIRPRHAQRISSDNGFRDIEIIVVYESFRFVEETQVDKVRDRLLSSAGFDVPETGRFAFCFPFDSISLESFGDEMIVRIIADTIKQVEMKEFEKWFRIKDRTPFTGDGRGDIYASSLNFDPQQSQLNQTVR